MTKSEPKSQPTWTDVKAKLAAFDRTALLDFIKLGRRPHRYALTRSQRTLPFGCLDLSLGPVPFTTRHTQTRREINSLRNYRERWASGSLFSVNATIQPFKQLCSSHGEGVTDAEQGRDRDGSTRLNLLPMARGKAKPNHVFLSETVGFAQLLYSLAKGTKELFLIDQACLLGDLWLDHHEQISWVKS